MFWRCPRRKKDGKEYHDYSVEESRRLQSGKVLQRRVLYLGEINDSQEAAWRKSLEVFDERQQRATTLSLFPEDRPAPCDAVDAIQVKLSEMQLHRARPYGNCWLGCELWRQLELDRLYRCLDRILEHRQELFRHLQQRGKTLFDVQFDVLLYELTSTYAEGAAEMNPKAKRGYVKIQLSEARQAVTRQTFTFPLDKVKLREAQRRDGHYLLRTNLVVEHPALLWDRYMQLVQVEAACKSLKSDLGLRPIYHQLEPRVEAHILIAFLAYCLTATLKYRLPIHAPGLSPRAVLEKLAEIQALDVCLPTTDGRRLVMPRYTEPDADVALLLHQLRLVLPQQPPPRLVSAPAAAMPQLKM